VKKYRQWQGLKVRLICDGQGTYGEAVRSYECAGDIPGVFVVDPAGVLQATLPGAPSLARLREVTGLTPAAKE
jgi:hypothetical protein